MKVGLLARPTDRGLGVLTREVHRNLKPAKTLVVQPDAARQMRQHHDDWFSGCPLVRFDGQHFRWIDTRIREWLDGLDVLLSAETYYDWRLVEWAREQGVRTVLWAMPEYFRPEWPKVDQVWNPTGWRHAQMPEGTRHVPVPVPVDRWPLGGLDLDVPDVPRWLHVAGARAQADRNGTLVVYQALRLLRREHHVTMRAQDENLHAPEVGRKVHLEQHTIGVGNYWDLYANADALLLPRRYGGLSLPALEAMGAGLGLVMADVEPQHSEWPILPVQAPFVNHIVTGAGEIPICAPDPADLARLMDSCAAVPDTLVEARRAARVWAERHSWDALRPKIIGELEHACSLTV